MKPKIITLNTFFRLLLIAITVSFFMGCKVVDKPELIPAWIEIDEFKLVTSGSSEGADSEKIKDCWVYVNSNLAGVYELPARIPIFENGATKIELFAGIYQNGIEGLRDAYPFYTSYADQMDLQPDSTYKVTPTIGYKDGLKIWIEDFEDLSMNFVKSADSDTTMYKAKTPVFQNLIDGDAGVVTMSSSTVLCQMQTEGGDFFDIPKNIDIPAYMEIQYKCNYEVEVGILTKDDQLSSFVRTPLITLFPTSNWNKSYLYLSDVTTLYPAADEVEIYFRVYNTKEQNNVEFLVDNIKVIYAE